MGLIRSGRTAQQRIINHGYAFGADVASSGRILTVVGSIVGVTQNGNGEFQVIFPVAFPNGLICIVASNGDLGAGTEYVNVRQAVTNGFVARFMGLTTNGVARRVNYIAYGW